MDRKPRPQEIKTMLKNKDFRNLILLGFAGTLIFSLCANNLTNFIFDDKIIDEKLFYDGFPDENYPVVEVSDFVGYDKNEYIYKLIPKEMICCLCAKILILCENAENEPKKRIFHAI